MAGYDQVVIIGAPRSGTNMLRDVLCRLLGCATWPCDEINYIWRHGNALWPSDELPAELATPAVRRYINRRFDRQAKIRGARVLVEKTCANSLRVPFVDRVLPTARYLFIHRRPLDAIASIIRRWQAPFELAYTLRKARYVPPSDVPVYAWRLLRNRLHRRRSGERRLASWGPRWKSMAALTNSRPLAEVCALQWNACVVRAATDLAALDPGRVRALSYEEFVAAPADGLRAICRFLAVPPAELERAVVGVSRRSVGKGARELPPPLCQRLTELAEPGRSALEAWSPEGGAGRPRPS